jgi:hypothetical protein
LKIFIDFGLDRIPFERLDFSQLELGLDTPALKKTGDWFMMCFRVNACQKISTPATALAAASYIGVWVQIVFLFGHGKFRRKNPAGKELFT